MPKQFIDLFEKIIIEYFEKVSSVNMTADVYTKSYSANIICIGLNTIIHIFRITMSKYKNTDITHHYCKQGFVYYLEYIQQILSSELQTNLNINDAITFVFSKTILPISELPESIIPNVDLNEPIKHMLNNLANVLNGILLWKLELSNEIRCEIIKMHLAKYILLPNLEKYVKFLPKLVDSNHLAYFYKNAKRINKLNTNLLDNDINNKLIIDYIIETTSI